MQETRQNRIARLLQKELAQIFQSQTRMMNGVMVSVTRAKVSPDLSICTAYLSVFPSEKGEEILKNINRNEKTIRYELGTRIRNQVRIIPELRFFIDDSLDYIERIDELLKKCKTLSLLEEKHARDKHHQRHIGNRCGGGNDGYGRGAERIQRVLRPRGIVFHRLRPAD